MNARHGVLAACAALCCLSVPQPALADWPAAGIEIVNTVPVLGTYPTGVLYFVSGGGPTLDTPEGDFLLVHSPSSQSYYYWTLQRFHRDGTLESGWPATGIQTRNTGRGEPDSWDGWVPTADGATWRAFPHGGKLWAFRVDQSGVVTSPAGTNGWQLGTSSYFPVAAAPAPSNGLYVATQNRLRRITPTGATAPGWPAGGMDPLTAFMTIEHQYTTVIADGEGGAYVFDPGRYGSGTNPTLNRVDSTGAVHAGWPRHGVTTGTLWTSFTDYGPMRTAIVRSGTDRVIVSWQDVTATTRLLRLQCYTSAGAIAPGWPSAGIVAAEGASASDFTLLADGSGGVYVMWFDYAVPYGTPRVTHLQADGTFFPGLDAVGRSPLPAGAMFTAPRSGGARFGQHYADVAPDGGLFYAWGDQRLLPWTTFRVRRMNADLSVNPAEPDSGRVVYTAFAPTFEYTYALRMFRSDGSGGFYIGYDDGGIRIQHLIPFAAVGVPPSAPHAGLLLRAPAPNPAREAITLRFSLPDARPATLTLFDVAGRALRTSQAIGAGEHTVRWDDAGALSPGLYLAQLRQGAEQRTARVVVTR